jgi:hypothetical protein
MGDKVKDWLSVLLAIAIGAGGLAQWTINKDVDPIKKEHEKFEDLVAKELDSMKKLFTKDLDEIKSNFEKDVSTLAVDQKEKEVEVKALIDKLEQNLNVEIILINKEQNNIQKKFLETVDDLKREQSRTNVAIAKIMQKLNIE